MATGPLVVDPDGTPCRSDTWLEALVGMVTRRPVALAKSIGRVRDGKEAFKTRVAAHFVIPGDALPYNSTVRDMVTEARAQGRMTYTAVTALAMVVLTVLGATMQHEQISLLRGVGLAAIVVGLVMTSVG